jgi:hypothetical protein
MGDESVWVTVGTLPPGSLFETRDGDRRLKSWGAYPAACISLTTGDVTWLLPHTPARPLTPVAVAPSLPADLRGLLLGALATGETDVLEDYLLDRRADPDVREAVRRNVLREMADDPDDEDDSDLDGGMPDDLDALWNGILNPHPVAFRPEPFRFPTITGIVESPFLPPPVSPPGVWNIPIRVARCPIVNHAPDCDCQGAGGDR